ncbi:MAG: hypothetical protein IJX91_04660 [Clostridia bacterium]|nr:hypothetical protein [Clostridia bacterium]
MKIEKNGKIYEVEDNKSAWVLSVKMGKVSLDYRISKSDCADFEALRLFVLENPTL